MTFFRLFSILFIVGAVLFCTVRLPAQTAGGTSQVSPVANLSGSNSSVVNNNFQYLQNGLNAALYEIQSYFPGGILQGNMGGTGVNSTNVASGDTIVASNGVWIAQSPDWVPNNIQIFTSSTTWVKPANVSTVYVKVIGGGGTGGTSAAKSGGSGNYGGPGGGGGGGGYSEGLIAVTGNVTVTISSTNSFVGSSTISATTGSTGGTGASNASSAQGGSGGSGGTGSGGTINLSGSTGGAGGTAVGTITPGNGGIGGGGWEGSSVGRGADGVTSTSSTSPQAGSAGDPGAVIVYY